MVTVLQFTENLTDCQAADAVRGRLLVVGLETAIFEALLARLLERGLLRAGGASTPPRARRDPLDEALEALVAAAPDWLPGVIDPSGAERYGGRIDSWQLPACQRKRAALAVQYGRDGYRLLDAVAAASAPEWLHRPGQDPPGTRPTAPSALLKRRDVSTLRGEAQRPLHPEPDQVHSRLRAAHLMQPLALAGHQARRWGPKRLRLFTVRRRG